jgi:hypothetical protein
VEEGVVIGRENEALVYINDEFMMYLPADARSANLVRMSQEVELKRVV